MFCSPVHYAFRRTLLLIGVVFFSFSQVTIASPPRPNFVIIIADDLGWDDVGTYGNSFVKTPNIDQLAAGGLRFDNAFLTTSSCSPSRGSILTGRYPQSNGSMHLHQGLPRGEVTVAQHLRDAGYFTASIGKWHVGRYATKDFDKVVDDRDSASGSAQWVAELEARPRDKPFFFWLAARDPHRIYDATEPDLPAALDPDDIVLPWGFVDGPGTRQELASYYREVRRFDKYVGEVVTTLSAQGAMDNTLILVMSDNGRPFHLGKMTLYDDGIKTPFVLHWPAGIAEGGVRHHMVSSIDIAPALMELAGLTPTEDMEGRSLVPLLGSPDAQIRTHVFAARNWHGKDAHERAIRTPEYLYKVNQFPEVGHCRRRHYGSTAAFRELKAANDNGQLGGWLANCFSDNWPRQELYRIRNGGVVWTNLIDDPDYQEVVETHHRKLMRWRQQTGDPDFKPWNPD